MKHDDAFERQAGDTGSAGAAYVEAGQGEPVIAIGDDRLAALRPSDIMLAKQRRVICFSVDAVSSSGQLAAAHIVAAIDRLHLDRFDLIGHGAGADVALWVAKLKGESVKSMVLVAPRGNDDQGHEDIQCPVLTLFGTNDEQASVERQQQARLRPPHSHLMYVYDAGVSVGRDRPEALASIASEFFERRNEFLVSRDNGMLFP